MNIDYLRPLVLCELILVNLFIKKSNLSLSVYFYVNIGEEMSIKKFTKHFKWYNMRIDELTIWNFDICKSITGNNYSNDNILSLRVWSSSFQIILFK